MYVRLMRAFPRIGVPGVVPVEGLPGPGPRQSGEPGGDSRAIFLPVVSGGGAVHVSRFGFPDGRNTVRAGMWRRLSRRKRFPCRGFLLDGSRNQNPGFGHFREGLRTPFSRTGASSVQGLPVAPFVRGAVGRGAGTACLCACPVAAVSVAGIFFMSPVSILPRGPLGDFRSNGVGFGSAFVRRPFSGFRRGGIRHRAPARVRPVSGSGPAGGRRRRERGVAAAPAARF